MPRRRDEDSGKYTESFDEDDFLDVLKGTRLGTSEVAQQVGCHRTTAHSKLLELEKAGKVCRDRVGNTFVWELPEV